MEYWFIIVPVAIVIVAVWAYSKYHQKQAEQQKDAESRDSPFDALDLEKEKTRREILHKNEPIRREQSARQQADECRERERIQRERTQTFECNVAGVTFGSRQKKIRTLYELTMSHYFAEVYIDLEPEPENKHDPYAIKVIAFVEYTAETAGGKERHHKKHIGMIGYVPADIAKQVSSYRWANASFQDAGEFWADDVGDDIIYVTIRIEARNA